MELNPINEFKVNFKGVTEVKQEYRYEVPLKEYVFEPSETKNNEQPFQVESSNNIWLVSKKP